MKQSSSTLVETALHRRDLIKAAAAAGALTSTLGAPPAAAQEAKIEAQEHWVMKGPVKLYLYRKRQVATGAAARPVLFLVHGSTFSSRGSYDLVVPGRTGYSAMDHFAGLGYDVWTMDHEGYGFSSRTGGHCGIQTGVEDLKAALPLVEQVTGTASVLMFGESSGAIKAGAFAMTEPKRVERLVLHAFTYTGENAPEIERRRKQADFYKANPRRPFGMTQVRNIFDRDVAGKADPALVKALADYELKFGDTVPSGTYLDMAINMPMVDPTQARMSGLPRPPRARRQRQRGGAVPILPHAGGQGQVLRLRARHDARRRHDRQSTPAALAHHTCVPELPTGTVGVRRGICCRTASAAFWTSGGWRISPPPIRDAVPHVVPVCFALAADHALHYDRREAETRVRRRAQAREEHSREPGGRRSSSIATTRIGPGSAGSCCAGGGDPGCRFRARRRAGAATRPAIPSSRPCRSLDLPSSPAHRPRTSGRAGQPSLRDPANLSVPGETCWIPQNAGMPYMAPW